MSNSVEFGFMKKILIISVLTGFITCVSAHEYIFRSTFDRRRPEVHTVAGFGWTQRQGDRALVMSEGIINQI